MSHPESEAVANSGIALVDWLSFSVTPPHDRALDWLDSILITFAAVEREVWQPTGRGWFGYTNRVDLGAYGLIAYGGESQRGTIHVELNAHGCARVADWSSFRTWGESEAAKITRVDLAHDDFHGATVNIEVMKQWYYDDGFTTGGRRPKARLIDDFDSGEGKTLYIGKREHGKCVRGYEKGKQLGDPQSPWFRVEVELHNKDRFIPWEIVTEPAKYLAGNYPCLAYLSIEQSRLHTQQRACAITYHSMESWVRRAAGKALNVMANVNDGDADKVMMRVVRPGAPKRLEGFEGRDFDGLGSQP